MSATIPFRGRDLDGHDMLCVWCLAAALNTPGARQVEGGLAKIGIGIGLVATVSVETCRAGSPGLCWLPIQRLGGAAMGVNGVTDVVGAATNTDVKPATEALEATSNLPGLALTAATGNIQFGRTVATIADAASLAAEPKEAIKNLATAADTVMTVGATASLMQKALDAVKGWFSSTPPPPSVPKASPASECSGGLPNSPCGHQNQSN